MKCITYTFLIICHVISTMAFNSGVAVIKKDISYRKTFVLTLNTINQLNNILKPTHILKCTSYPQNERDRDSRIMRLQRAERDSDIRIVKLEREVKKLETVVEELCSALLFCDDIALMERQSRCSGEIYMDTDSGIIRAPRLIRQELSTIMHNHNIRKKPLMHSWRPRENQVKKELQDDIDKI